MPSQMSAKERARSADGVIILRDWLREKLSGGLRVALRETAEALRFLQEDIIDRMSALGHAINGLREMGEL